MPPSPRRYLVTSTLLCLALVVGIAQLAKAEHTQSKATRLAASSVPPRGTPAKRAWIIHRVFGSSGAAAVRVAMCESGLRPWARNGQYRGMFQMGSSERARFGHDDRNAWVQSRAARRYFLIAGWSPWACKP